MTRKPTIWIFPILAVLGAGCDPTSKPDHARPPAATVTVDGERVVVGLTAAAAARLGIETAVATTSAIVRVRQLAGEARVPPGRSILLAAPLSGRVLDLSLAVGARVAADATLLTLAPMLSADSLASLAAMRVDADGAVITAKALRDGADLALARAQRMLGDGVGSERAVEEARVARDTAAANLLAAESRRDPLVDDVAGPGAPLPIRAPFAGVLTQLAVSRGQLVAAGSALAEVTDTSRLWIRVPVPVDEVGSLDAGATIPFDGLQATPAAAPQSGSSATNSVDLWYEVEGADAVLRPGQPVVLPVPLAGETTRLLVPWSAVIRDARGNAFVYVQDGELRYARRAVQVLFVHQSDAAVQGDVAAGDRVVRRGVPELWGIDSGHAN